MSSPRRTTVRRYLPRMEVLEGRCLLGALPSSDTSGLTSFGIPNFGPEITQIVMPLVLAPSKGSVNLVAIDPRSYTRPPTLPYLIRWDAPFIRPPFAVLAPAAGGSDGVEWDADSARDPAADIGEPAEPAAPRRPTAPDRSSTEGQVRAEEKDAQATEVAHLPPVGEEAS